MQQHSEREEMNEERVKRVRERESAKQKRYQLKNTNVIRGGAI